MKSKTLYTISRWLMAVLFIFSGLTKSVNPFGFSVQLGEYLNSMGLAFLKPLAPLGGIAIPSFELLLGIMLALGLSKRFTSWAVLLFMGFFTCLTLWIATTNPVSDCGCFGDVLKISNWETFIKNVILMPFAIILFVNRGREKSTSNHLYILAIPLSLALAIYSYFNLPLIDATPYKIGVNIPKAMSIPEGADRGESHTVLIYKNTHTGKTKEFEIEDPAWQDESQWEYVDTKTTVIREGFVPTIKNLPMLDGDGTDHAGEVLEQQGKLLLIATNNLEDLNSAEIQRIANKYSGRVVILSSSPMSLFPETQNVQLFQCDHTVISTLIQNQQGGALELQNGTIIRKMVMRNISKI